MRIEGCRPLAIAVVALFIIGALAAPPAGADDEHFHIRGFALWMDTDFTFEEFDDSGNRLSAVSDDEIGLGVSIELRLTRRMGIEFGAMFAEPALDALVVVQGDLVFDTRGELSITPLTAGLNFHLVPGPIDVYFGPFAAFVSYGNTRLRLRLLGQPLSFELESEDDFAFGAQIGVDLELGGTWTVGASIKFIDTRFGVADSAGVIERVEFDPLIVTGGLGFRF